MESGSEPNQRDFCAPSLALAFLSTGIAYALPLRLFPNTHQLNGYMSPEILNLYCLVSWFGLSHFIYAYYGQGKAFKREPSKILPFAFGGLAGLMGLLSLRFFLGWQLFSFVMWVYFIPHFVRAEMHFASVLEKQPMPRGWGLYWFPTLAFAFLTWALFCPEPYS